MTIDLENDGSFKMKIYRKNYKKARFKKHGMRIMKMMMKENPGYSVLIPGCERTK